MSGYIVEELNETPIFINSSTNEEREEYWRLYSPIQRKRFYKVLKQLRETWFDVYKTIKFINETTYTNIDKELMPKVYKLFIIEHKHKIEFYKQEKILQRKQKNYLSKKINKLKNTIQKI
jgi:hypothetical protein